MVFCRFLRPVLLVVICSFMDLDQVTGGEQTKGETGETRTIQQELFIDTRYQAVPIVVPITTETAEVYECVYGADPETANYTWYRQDCPSLPEGTKAEGNRLHFIQSTSNLNGLYICTVRNEYGTSVATFYRKIQDCTLHRILKSVFALWMLLK